MPICKCLKYSGRIVELDEYSFLASEVCITCPKFPAEKLAEKRMVLKLQNHLPPKPVEPVQTVDIDDIFYRIYGVHPCQ
jgi:hypothetical protein